MRPLRITLSALVLAIAAVGSAQAKDDMDVARLNSSLDQLARDPALSGYAQAEQEIGRAHV